MTASAEHPHDLRILFQALKAEKSHPDDILVKIITARKEKQPTEWAKFESENQPLLKQIFIALDTYQAFQYFEARYTELSIRQGKPEAEAFCSHEHLTHLQLEAWGLLAPLLDQAKEKMSDCGIRDQKFDVNTYTLITPYTELSQVATA